MFRISDDTEVLARRLAEVQHLTVEETVRQALEARARAAGLLPEPGRPRDPSPEATAMRRATLTRLVHQIAAMPIRDARSAQEIVDDLNDT